MAQTLARSGGTGFLHGNLMALPRPIRLNQLIKRKPHQLCFWRRVHDRGLLCELNLRQLWLHFDDQTNCRYTTPRVQNAHAITALELGAGFDSPIVKVCVLLAAPLLLVTTADAALRIWRSAWAWMPVDRGRALFRLAWLIPAGVFFVLVIGAVLLVLGA